MGVHPVDTDGTFLDSKGSLAATYVTYCTEVGAVSGAGVFRLAEALMVAGLAYQRHIRLEYPMTAYFERGK